MVVLADEDLLWLELGQDVASSVADLNKLLIMEDAQITDRSNDFQVLSLVGAGVGDAVQDVAGSVPDRSVLYSHLKSGDVRVVRSELGYDLIVRSGQTDQTLNALVKHGVQLADRETWDLLTLEAGIPRYGIDVDDTTTLPELGDKGIDYQKGCYIGQEVVAKIKYLGHVNRNLVGLKLEGLHSPLPGADVRGNDKTIGAITRADYSPGLGSVIALAYLRLGNEAPGTSVEVVVNDVTVSGEVSGLPFISYFE
jgi:aminomethyltransferase